MSEQPATSNPAESDSRPPYSGTLHEIANEVNMRYPAELRQESFDPDLPDPDGAGAAQRQEDLNALYEAASLAGRNVSSRLRATLGDIVDPDGELYRRSAERKAQVDPLTGLGNRQALERARATAEADPATSFLMIDGDNFGQVNKKFDFATGDAVIQAAAKAIEMASAEENLRSRIFILQRPPMEAGVEPGEDAEEMGAPAFRPGGDEFVVLGSEEKLARIRERAAAIFRGMVDQGLRVGDPESGTVLTRVALTEAGVALDLSSAVGGTMGEADVMMQSQKQARKARQKTDAARAAIVQAPDQT
jgi:GGDEF domain-containing protein